MSSFSGISFVDYEQVNGGWISFGAAAIIITTWWDMVQKQYLLEPESNMIGIALNCWMSVGYSCILLE